MSDCYHRCSGIVTALVLTVFLAVVPVLGQAAREDFEVDVLSARSETNPDRVRVDTYTRIPYTHLNFINSINGFTASYEVKLDATQLSGDGRIRNLVQSKIWDANVAVNTYALTQAEDSFDYTTQSLELAPGRYIFEYSVTDRNSSQTHFREFDVTIRDLSGPVAISDITLLESFDQDNLTIVPRIDGRIGSDDPGFQVFYEIYADRPTTVVVKQEVSRTRKDAAVPSDAEGDAGELVFSKEEVVDLKTGRTQKLVTVPVEGLRVGGYQFTVRVESLTGTLLTSADRAIIAEWSGLEQHIQDIDDAIAQLEYIAKKRDLNFIQSAPNEVERFQRFRSFWEKRDPTPGTKRNERMEEYYYRIASANRNYGAVTDGWRTDRGFVLVRFGEPDFIQKKPHSFDYEPYEVWIYERIGRQFIFVDKTGFGDYQLWVPVWDERTKLY